MKHSIADFFEDRTLIAIATIILGVVLALLHSAAIKIVCIILGVIAMGLGIYFILKYLTASEKYSRYNLLAGLVLGAVGLSVVISPSTIENIVAVIFGILILFHGITDLVDAIKLQKHNYKLWFLSLIFAIVTVIIGILLIILQKQVLHSVTLLLGIALIIDGIMGLWTALKVKKSNV